MAAPGEVELNERVARLRASGASDKDIQEYQRDWDIAYGGSKATDPNHPNFSPISDTNVDPDFDAANPVKAISAFLSGAFKGAGGLVSFPVWGLEKLGQARLRAYGSKATLFKDVTPPSQFIQEPFDSAGEAVKAFTNADTDTSLGLRYLETVGEYVTPGAITTKATERAGRKIARAITDEGMLPPAYGRWGKNLEASLPQEVKGLRRLALEAARNPKKMQALEAVFNTTSAISGQTAFEMAIANGASEEEAGWWKIGASLGTAVVGPSTQRLVSKVKELANSKLGLTDSAREAIGERIVSHFFNDIMDFEGETGQQYLAASRIEQIYKKYTGDASGLDLTTAQVTRSPPVIAAERKVMSGKPLQAVEAQRHMKDQARKTEAFVQAVQRRGPNENIDEWHQRMRDSVEAETSRLQFEIDHSVMDAEREAITFLDNGDPVALGNLGRRKLNDLYEEMDNRIDAMYKTVADVPIKNSSLKSAWKEATESKLEGYQPIPKWLDDIYNLTFKDKDMSSVDQLRQFQKLIRGELRGNLSPETFRRMTIIDQGIQSQFARAASKDYESDLGMAAQHLEIANNLNKRVSEMFKSGELKRLVAEDAQGVSVVSAEDFFTRFVRSNTQGDRFKVAEDYAKAFGSPNAPGVSRDLIRQAFLVSMRNSGVIDPATKTINTRAAQRWVQQHSDNIKAFGLEGEFDNIGDAARKAAEIKSTNTLQIRDIEKSVFAQSIKEDPKEYVRSALNSGRVSRLLGAPDVAQRGYKQLAWEVLLESTQSGGKIGVGDTAVLVRDPAKLGTLLDRNEMQLKKLLGPDHFNDLRTVQKLMETTSPVHAGRFEGSIEQVLEQDPKMHKLKMSIWAKLWAAHRGFVSPQFAAAYVLNQTVESIGWRAVEGTFEKALRDPNTARVLANSARNKEEAHALRSIYSAVVAPLTQANDEEEDPTKLLRPWID